MALFGNKGSDFLSKMKDAANTAAEKAKEAADTAKTTYEAKKAEEEAKRLQLTEAASLKSTEIKTTTTAGFTGVSVFEGINKEDLLKFTKEFFDKIILPASSVSNSKILMHPHLDTDKKFNKFIADNSFYDKSEVGLIYFRPDAKQEFVFTDKALYFSIPTGDANGYFAKERIPYDSISNISFVTSDADVKLMCNGYEMTSVAFGKAINEDAIGLNNYFTAIAKKDFEITDAEVDALIKEKIGGKVLDEVKKYLVYDDEILTYFAWGLDSLSAKDYIFCTDKQIVMMNREMLGATANIKQFYYEDITSASTEQNATSNDLTVALIETAITAATKTCDLVLSVAGSTLRINTLYKIEAERIVALYHHYRKAAKTANAQPTVVVQQQQQIDPMEQLKKLAELKELGIVTQEEFDAKKAQLLGL